MYGVLIALIPAFLVSLYFFGLGALIVTATSVAACLFFEWAIGKYLLKKPTTTICDGSAIITGVLLAFNLPSNLPVWIIILGALFAIGVGKMSFGGLGCNPFNPALAGRVFLLLSFPVQMTSWPVVGQLTAYTDATTGATPLALMKQAIYGNTDALSQIPDALSLLIGQNGGCLGEVSALALLVGTMLFMALIVSPFIMFIYLGCNPYPLVFRCLRESGLTAFFTRSSAANIPVNMALCEKLGLDKDMYSVSIPLGATINMDGAAITITIMTLAAANTLGIQVSLPAAIVLSAMSALGACGASGVAGGSLLLIPMACSLFGISNDVAMQMVGVGFIIGVVQDSVETALNSAGDVEFAATAEYHQWRKQGKSLPEFLTGKKN